jgi:hypothetical protein
MLRESDKMRVVERSLVVACFLATAFAAQARRAPNPLPSYASLTPATTWHVATNVSDQIGNFKLLGTALDKPVYVWDIGMARLYNGTVVIYQYEFQAPDDSYIEVDRQLPTGSTVITSMDDTFGTAYVHFFDGTGTLQMDNASSFGAGEIGGDGTISLGPGHEFGPGRTTCGTIGGISVCGKCSFWLGPDCSYNMHGWCECYFGCPMIYATRECGGSCPGNWTCIDTTADCICWP